MKKQDNNYPFITNWNTNGYRRKNHPLRYTDQNVNTTKFGYDTENRLISITDVVGATIRYGYDNSGNLNSVTYPNRETIYYEYDPETRSLRIKKEVNSDLNKSSAGNEKGDLG